MGTTTRRVTSSRRRATVQVESDGGSTPATIDIDRAAALKLVLEMMAISGRSGYEGNVAARIKQELLSAGVPAEWIETDDLHRRSPHGGEVGNLICRMPGTLRGPRRLFMAHIDTVPLCQGSRPVVKDGHVHSADPRTALGADDRAGASTLLVAAIQIMRRNLPHPPLTFFWPVQEEVGLYGSRLVRMGLLGHPRLAFNWDGGMAHHVIVGATGDYRIEIEVEGRASHAGAAPHKGVSAVVIASCAIADLAGGGWHGRIVKGRHRGTSNVGVIAGGDATNVVTPHLRLRAEARSHDPRFRLRIVQAYRKAFERAARQVKNDEGARGQVHLREQLSYEAFRLRDDEPCVLEAERALRAVGLTPERRVIDGGLDANWLTARGLPTVTLGCGQSGAHTFNERLDVDAYLHACQVALLLATGGV
jgi:tripeptide aminopeptidase